ncbi:hypothetical protein DEFDS_P176 (plasmid) [Deferribacter desulfuricans SSM1]|uniref:Uncharacterized protein n=1 Tax=Deferribacter desulfuricans (strain DSM 14783 / JCM 11476 / NBRC 101012 / SSM1) TaxID=639282 RepID=D3PF04_DEFDS|nr:hypothetical protein [Deferribacter desulfuricans]BAI81796.1 hypothetical protein DEFDS_P176 [Deferribacter desulfuricans SSM1]
MPLKAKWYNMSLSTKIFVYLISIIIIFYIILGFYIVNNIKSNIINQVTNQLIEETKTIKSFLQSTDQTNEELRKKVKEDFINNMSDKLDTLLNTLTVLYEVYSAKGMPKPAIEFQLAQEILQTSIGENGYAYALIDFLLSLKEEDSHLRYRWKR